MKMDGEYGDGYDDRTVDAFTGFYARHIPPGTYFIPSPGTGWGGIDGSTACRNTRFRPDWRHAFAVLRVTLMFYSRIILSITVGEDGLIVNEVDSQSDEDVPLPYTEVKKTVITMLALPHDAADGDHTVYIDRPDPMTGEIETFALCTLNKKRCPHVRTESMFIDDPVRMHHTGESVVSVTGYDTVEIMGYGPGGESDDDLDDYDYSKALLGESDDEDSGDSGDDSEGSDDETSEDEGDDAPDLVGLSIPSPSEDDSILEADVSDSELDIELGDDGGDDDDDEDGSSSDGDSSSGSDDDDDDDDDDESMDIASDTDDEDVREAMRLRLKSLSTPQPGGPKKKQKTEAPVAASAPAKVSNPKVPTNEAEYGAALRAYIQQHGGKDGSVPLQQLGNSVKRPSAVSRLKKYLEANKDKFAVDKKANTVKLA